MSALAIARRSTLALPSIAFDPESESESACAPALNFCPGNCGCIVLRSLFDMLARRGKASTQGRVCADRPRRIVALVH
eukprot:4464853-Prymnesium_polylepis.2